MGAFAVIELNSFRGPAHSRHSVLLSVKGLNIIGMVFKPILIRLMKALQIN